MSLIRLRSSITQMASHLKRLASIINQLGLFLPPGAIKNFQIYQQRYLYFHGIHENEVQGGGKDSKVSFVTEAETCDTEEQKLKCYLFHLLEEIAAILEPPLLIEKLTDVFQTLTAGEGEGKEEKKGAIVSSLDTKTGEKALQAFLVAYQGLEKAFAESFELAHIGSRGIIAQRLRSHFPAALRQQHVLYDLSQQLNSLEYHPQKPPLRKATYQELAIITWLVRPDWVIIVLKRKEEHQRKQLLAYKKQYNQLKERLEANFSSVMRTFRIIAAYQKWDNYLQQQCQLRAVGEEKFSTLLANQELVTYQKKAFFKTLFNQQKAYLLINELHAYLEKNCSAQTSSSLIVQGLLQLRKQLRQQIKDREQALFKKTRFMPRMVAGCVLAMTQQSTYQLGVISSRALSKETESFSLPILRERLPKDLQKKLETAVGMSFLSIALTFSNTVGYSWQLIAAFNHILFAHYDMMVMIGDYADQATQKCCMPALKYFEQYVPSRLKKYWRRLEEFARWDEVGLHEKEKLISYFTGLGLQLIMSGGEHLAATAGAYAMATAGGELAMWTTEEIGSRCLLSDNAVSALKVMTHMATYSAAYRYGFQLIHEKTKAAAPAFSQAKALKLFGLSLEEASESEIHARYRQLALENHPDKCGTTCKIPFDDINKAYRVLAKKMA